MIRLIATALMALGLVLPGVLFADSKWATLPSFGISVHPESGTHPVITFIPATTLLFDVDLSKQTKYDDEPYTAVTTQDGVRLYILDKYISDRNTSEGLGNFSVIFHSARRICTTDPGCNTDEVNESLEIHPGNIFNKSAMQNDQISLTGQRNGVEISGIISARKLKKWNREGVVTFTDRPQPRLSVTRKQGKYFDLKCGHSKRRDDGIQRVDGEDINEYDRIINDHLELAYIGGNDTTEDRQDGFDVEFRTDYGGGDLSYKHRVYIIKEDNPGTDEDAEKIYAAQIIYVCTRTGTVSSPQRIDSVVLKQKDGQPVTLKPWGTPPDLERFTGTPHYLYSVNSRQQYFSLMSRLGELFPNRAESGYFLAEFNRSCNSSSRTTESCATHSYERSEQQP